MTSGTEPEGLTARARARSGAAALVIIALAVGSVACTRQASPPPSVRHVNSLGCYVGAFHLKVSPSPARSGEVVTVSASGPWRGRDVGTDSYGLLGTNKDGHFVRMYYLAAITPGGPRRRNIPVSRSVGVGGVGLPNRPFQIEVPPVRSGDYIIQFDYSVTPAPTGSGGSATYDLCAPLHVTY